MSKTLRMISYLVFDLVVPGPEDEGLPRRETHRTKRHRSERERTREVGYTLTKGWLKIAVMEARRRAEVSL